MIRYTRAEDVEKLARKIVEALNLKWINLNRVYFIRSFGSKSKAIARCYGLSRIWQFAMKTRPKYIIEVISEKFDKLSEKEKIKILIHELLHIPKKFSGGLRDHRYVTERRVDELFREYLRKEKSKK